LQQPFADGCCKQQSLHRQQQQAIKHINKSKEPSRPIDDPAMENVPKVFDVIDPSNPTGKISVPSEHVSNTVGKTKYVKNLQKPANKQKDFSLCLLHHAGWCKLGVKCQQIHADPALVNNFRQVAGGSNCCTGHGDQRSQEPAFTALVGGRMFCRLEKLDGRFEKLQLSQLSRTVALESALQADERIVTVSMSKVCRLHQEERCRFGRDCKNFHLCRDVYARLQLAHINIKAAPPVLQTAPCKPLKTVDIPQLAASISPQSPAYSSAGSARQPSTPAQRHSTPPPMVLQRWPLSFSFSRDRSLSAGWESEQSDSPGPSSGSPSPTSSPLRDGRLSTQTLQVMQALESFRSEFRGAPVVR